MEAILLKMACLSKKYLSKCVRRKRLQYIVLQFFFRVSQALILGTASIANSLAFTPNFTKGLEAARNVKRFLARVPLIQDNINATDKQTVSRFTHIRMNFVLQ